MLKLSITLLSVLFVVGATGELDWSPRQYLELQTQQSKVNVKAINKMKPANELARKALRKVSTQVENLGRVEGAGTLEISRKINALISQIDRTSVAGLDISDCKQLEGISKKKYQSTIDEMDNCVAKTLLLAIDSQTVENQTYENGLARLAKIDKTVLNCQRKESFGEAWDCVAKANDKATLLADEIVEKLRVETQDSEILAEKIKSNISLCDRSETLKNIYKEMVAVMDSYDKCVRRKF